MVNRKQVEKSKNRNVTNKKNSKQTQSQTGLKEGVRVVYSGENNPHDG